MAASASTDLEKGQHTKNLLSCYDALLDVRIRSQRCLNEANKLPTSSAMNAFLSAGDGPSQIAQAQNIVKRSLLDLMDSLLAIKHDFIEENIVKAQPSDDGSKALF